LGAAVFLVALGRSLAPLLSDSMPRYFLPSGFLLMSAGAFYALFATALVTDNRLVVLTRRELASYFYSPIAYIVLFGLTAVGWLTYLQFVDRLVEFAARGTSFPEPIVRLFFIDIYPVMTVIFVVPVVTMRLLSEERRTGTLEVLLTAPVGEVTVVLSKFFAALIYYLFLWIPWGLFLLALRLEGGSAFDYRPLLSFAVILVATGAAFIAMGVFFSALTRNQIIAAVLTFLGMMVLLAFFFLKDLERIGPNWQNVFTQLGFVDLWIESLNGKLYLRSVILQLSLAVFWLFLAVKALEARKWS
jgi:ABC-type transport system involved in multi-copper enzyme maturation permease subunit